MFFFLKLNYSFISIRITILSTNAVYVHVLCVLRTVFQWRIKQNEIVPIMANYDDLGQFIYFFLLFWNFPVWTFIHLQFRKSLATVEREKKNYYYTNIHTLTDCAKIQFISKEYPSNLREENNNINKWVFISITNSAYCTIFFLAHIQSGSAAGKIEEFKCNLNASINSFFFLRLVYYWKITFFEIESIHNGQFHYFMNVRNKKKPNI